MGLAGLARDKIKQKPLLFLVEVVAFYLIVGLLHLIPTRWRIGFAGRVTRWIGVCLPGLNRRIYANLAIGLPDLDPQQQKQVAREVCHVDRARIGTRIRSQESRDCLVKARASAQRQVAAIVASQRGG